MSDFTIVIEQSGCDVRAHTYAPGGRKHVVRATIQPGFESNPSFQVSCVLQLAEAAAKRATGYREPAPDDDPPESRHTKAGCTKVG